MTTSQTDREAVESALIAVGRIELRQVERGGQVTITHTGKTGARVSIVLPASTLEAWAIRQMRAEVFAG